MKDVRDSNFRLKRSRRARLEKLAKLFAELADLLDPDSDAAEQLAEFQREVEQLLADCKRDKSALSAKRLNPFFQAISEWLDSPDKDDEWGDLDRIAKKLAEHGIVVDQRGVPKSTRAEGERFWE